MKLDTSAKKNGEIVFHGIPPCNSEKDLFSSFGSDLGEGWAILRFWWD